METIKLNKKKKIIMWKRILIAAIIAAAAFWVTLGKHFRIQYKYYAIDEYGNKKILGISDNSNLIDKAVYQKISDAKSKNYDIAEYNLDTIVNKKFIISFKKSKNKDSKIQSAIENYVYIITYAYKVDNCIFSNNQRDYVEKEIDDEDIFIEGTFININEVMNDKQLKKCIQDYKED